MVATPSLLHLDPHQLNSHSFLTSNLFQSNFITDMSSDLLHEALIRKMRIDAAMRGAEASLSPDLSGPASDSGLSDDGNYTPVHTRPGTPVGTPRRSHFASSGASTPAASRSSSPTRRRKEKKALEEQEKKASRDPLKKFENDVSSRIFRELDVIALTRCKRVSKRWNRSATISECFCDVYRASLYAGLP